MVDFRESVSAAPNAYITTDRNNCVFNLHLLALQHDFRKSLSSFKAYVSFATISGSVVTSFPIPLLLQHSKIIVFSMYRSLNSYLRN